MRAERLAPAAPKPAGSAVGVIALLLLTLGECVSLPAFADVGDTLPPLTALIVLVGLNPLGIGWGQRSYQLPPGTRRPGVGVREYPHNVFIEVGFKAGVSRLVGDGGRARPAAEGAAAGVHAASGVRHAVPSGVRALINSMVSGDVGDSRDLWVAVAAALATRRTSVGDELVDPEIESVIATPRRVEP
jgi:hypothetical protein